MADKTRTRKRAVDVVSGTVPIPTQEMLDDARKAFTANKMKNKSAGAERAALASLAKAMAKSPGLNTFKLTLDEKIAGGTILEVLYGATEGDMISMEKLIDQVGIKEAVIVAGVTKQAVLDKWGTNMVDLCTVKYRGDVRVRVKEQGKK